jgi:hypothetical protein
MSVAAARGRPKGQTSRRTWVLALGLAAFTHGVFMGWGALIRFPDATLAEHHFQPVQWLETDVTIELPLQEGGGSAVVGGAIEAQGNAPKPPEPKLPVAAKARPKPLEAPKPRVAPEPEVEEPTPSKEGAALFDEKEAWSEQDVLFAEATDDAFTVRPRRAFSEGVTTTSFAERLSGDGVPQDGKHLGKGEGMNGGDGGLGLTLAAPVVVEQDFAFGGKEGAFLGRMCFVQQNLSSLKSLGACATRLTFRTDRINIPPRRFDQGFPGIPNRDEWFSILYTGTVQISKPGRYSFRVLSDDGSVLHIDGHPVVDNDGLHGPSAVQGDVELSEGPHKLELWYFQGPRLLVALQVFVTPPGEGERLLEPSL